MSAPLDDYHAACRHAEACLDLIRLALCFRCAVEHGHRPPAKRFHHCGRVYTHLSGAATEAQIAAWADDRDHGLCHGLSTAVMAGLVIRDEFGAIADLMSAGGERLFVKEKNLRTRAAAEPPADAATYSDYASAHCAGPLSFERLVASCVLHDFARCGGGEAAGHDARLRGLFPDLLEATYGHAAPAAHDHPLLIADVLELRRFPGHRAWYRPEVVEPGLSPAQRRVADCYYRCVRPALDHAHRHRDQIWLGHGPEVPQDVRAGAYPQHPAPWAAVETDRLPFGQCFRHDRHTAAAPWGALRGAIPLSRLKELGGRVRPHMEFPRDHLYAAVAGRVADWVFVTDRDSPARQPWVAAMAADLVAAGAMVVELAVLNKFIAVAATLRDRVLAINT